MDSAHIINLPATSPSAVTRTYNVSEMQAFNPLMVTCPKVGFDPVLTPEQPSNVPPHAEYTSILVPETD
jgi:hypothetical protein